MSVFRLLIIGLVVAITAASAADARYRHHHRDRHDGFDVGDAIVGAAVLGGIIAIANAAGKKRENERRADPPAPPAPYPGDWQDNAGWSDDDRWSDTGMWDYADPDYARRFPSERAAIDDCAREAEALGGRYGAEARLSRIYDVSRSGEDYRVTGLVRIDDRRASRPEDAAFSCYAAEEGVTGFRFEEQTAARY